MSDSNFRNFPRGVASDKFLHYKAFEISKNS